MKPFEEFQSRVESISMRTSVEKQRVNALDNEMPPEILLKDLMNNLKNNGFGTHEANGVSSSNNNPLATPGNSGALLFIPDMIHRFSILRNEHYHMHSYICICL